jgi:hypothetical protein
MTSQNASISPTDEIRRIRRDLSSKFDYDLDRIVDDLQSKQRETIRLPRRSPRTQSARKVPNPRE